MLPDCLHKSVLVMTYKVKTLVFQLRNLEACVLPTDRHNVCESLLNQR